MKIILDISPEELKQLVGADNVEQIYNDHIKRQLDITNGKIALPMSPYEQDFRDQWPKSVEEYWKQHSYPWMDHEESK